MAAVITAVVAADTMAAVTTADLRDTVPAAPAVTTPGQAVTTLAPAVTTPAPAVTTPAPAVTTPAPALISPV